MRHLIGLDPDIVIPPSHPELSFKEVWRWLAAIMDSAEAQLRYGNSLNRFMESLVPGQGGPTTARFIGNYNSK